MYFRKLKKRWMLRKVGEVTAGTEEFRTFIFEKVQSALNIVCTDGITAVNVDNVMPLLKSLDVDTSDGTVNDLITDSLIDNFGEIVPLDLDNVVQKSQEAKEETEMDDCLEVAFKLIDFDEDGFITQPDIYQLMLRLGEMLGDYALDDMVAAVDMDQDGKISLRDFRYFLLGRDVPSRKEIFAMAEEARKKREEQEKAQAEAEAQGGQPAEAVAEGEPNTEAGEGADANATVDSNDTPSTESNEKTTDDSASSENKDVTDAVSSNDKTTAEGDNENSSEAAQKQALSTPPKTAEQIAAQKRRSMFGGGFVETPRSSVGAGLQGVLDTASKAEDEPPDAGSGVASQTNNTDDKQTENQEVAETESALEEDATKMEDAVEEENVGDASRDFDDDEDEDEARGPSPIPLGTAVESLNLPPPDLSAVDIFEPSPVATPFASPRRRPTIVSIGGLCVSPTTDEAQGFADAIEILQNEMLSEHTPSQRRRSSARTVDESFVNTVEDIEDFNNRLVFKLPPRRRSSASPATVPSPQTDDRPSSGIGDGYKPTQSYKKASVDSDEGIDLAEEEIIEQTVCVPCSAQPPSSFLRISLPDGNGAFCEEQWDGATPRITAEFHRKADDDKYNSQERQANDKNMLGVAITSDTPRSISRSELSFINASLTSPRPDDSSSDEDEDILVNENDIKRNIRRRGVRSQSAKTVFSTASNQSQYECDADSVLLSIQEGDLDTHRSSTSRYLLGSSENLNNGLEEDVFHSPTTPTSPLYSPSLQRKKTTPRQMKSSLSCQTIELKEMELNAPVTADQFSNRRKFGMIPRDVSKFLVLGKSTKLEDAKGSNPNLLETRGRQGSYITRTSQEKLSPTLRWESSRRPRTAVVTSRERDVLQNRRISLMHDEFLPLYDQQRKFDFPSASSETINTIEVPCAGHENTVTDSLLDRVKSMENRILTRSKTSFELPVVKENEQVPATSRSDTKFSASKPRALSASTSLYSKSPRELKPQDKRLSVVDLSRRLRKDTVVKSNASLSRRHSGFKSIVPLARVVMAYQSVKRRRQSQEFYSISRQLEKSGVPYQAHKSSSAGAYAAEGGVKDKKKKKSKKGRIKSARKGEEKEPFPLHQDDDVSTLVGDLRDPDAENDPDIIPQEVVYEKVRPFTAHPTSKRGDWSRRNEAPYPGLRVGSGVTHSSVLTLKLPEDTHFDRKLKNVSLLSKLPLY